MSATHYRPIPLGTKKTAFTAASAQVAALNPQCTVIRVLADEDCFIEFGVNPTATITTSTPILSGIVEYFTIAQGDKIAVIRATADGNLYVSQMS